MASPAVLPSFEFNAMYIHALRQGDLSAEEHFVSHFSPILTRKLRKKLRCTDMVYDARQETFMRVLAILRSEKGVRNPERFEVMVLAVCNNVVREVYRHNRRMAQIEPEFDVASPAPGQDKCIIAAEAGNYVHELLSNLSPTVSAILQAVFLEEADRDEVCLRFGVTRNYLRLLIHRAKKALEDCSQYKRVHKPAPQMRPRRRVPVLPLNVPLNTPAPRIVNIRPEPCPVPIFLPALNRPETASRPMLAAG